MMIFLSFWVYRPIIQEDIFLSTPQESHSRETIFIFYWELNMANECIRVTRVSMRNVVEDTNDE